MSDILNTINDLLNEEKWTRATLSNFTVSSFEQLDEVIEKIIDEGVQDEVLKTCEEHLESSQNSISGLYIAGILSLKKHQVDDSNVVHLINIFSDNSKWNIVECLAKRILEYGENKFALRTLTECYKNENRESEIIDIWIRLIRIDYEETTIVKLLSEKMEEEGKIEEAIIYYKKAIHRYINKRMFSNVKEVWLKLVELIQDDIEFFMMVESKISRAISSDKASMLLEELYPIYFESNQWDTAILILKKVLSYDSKNNWARSEIVKCFQGKYADHSQLDEYIRLANLSQAWRDVNEAIDDFEKHISFDKGNFVFHKSWGVGRIKNIEGDDIIIDFVNKRNHKMSLKMTVNALMSLAKNHIWVLKSVLSKDKLKAKVKSDAIWALKTIIRSFNNAADIKKIKSELVPSILTQGEWSSWSSDAREKLKTDPSFGNNPEKLDEYVVRDKPMSYEERTYNRFKAEKDFFDRLSTIQEFLDKSDPDSDLFAEMFQYFNAFLKSANINSHVVCSWLYVHQLAKTYPFLNPNLNWGFKELFLDIDDVPKLFLEIKDNEFKKEFLYAVQRDIEEWPDIFLQLFPLYQDKIILEELMNNGFQDKVELMINNIIERYRDFREAYCWIVKKFSDDPHWMERSSVSYEKILINLLHLLDMTLRDISNKKDVTFNRKINRTIQTFLFKEERLQNYILNGNKDTVRRLYSLIYDIKELDPKIKMEMESKIQDKFGDVNYQTSPEKEDPIEKKKSVSRTFLVIEKSLNDKKKELKHILDVEIPKNSKEIGAAIELGDLKENAEYKAGKERQENLNIQVGKLKDEIERANVIDPNDFNNSQISFGTVVKLMNNISNKDESFTILGPWESNPSDGIISYQSPLGIELLGAKVEENLKFVINERDLDYTVVSIDIIK